MVGVRLRASMVLLTLLLVHIFLSGELALLQAFLLPWYAKNKLQRKTRGLPVSTVPLAYPA